MEFALLIYGISLLDKIIGFFIFVSVISGIVLFGGGIISCVSYGDSKKLAESRKVDHDFEIAKRVTKHAAIILVISSLFTIIIPSEKTAYLMLGGYTAQKIVQSDNAQEISGKLMKIINQKLDSYIED